MPRLPLRQQPLSIFSASAGAGKTFRLAAEYIATALRDPLQPQSFRQILALTFTNKAAHEMKRRILDSLRDFSEEAGFGDSKGLAEAVQEILGISPEELAMRSRKTLEAMLHDYGAIGIGTLDQFTHRLVRTFALELGLPGQFDVELEQNLLLELAVNELMNEVGRHAELTNVLVAYAQSNVEDEKGGDLYPALLDMAKHLTQESSTEALRALGAWSMSHHGVAQENLRQFQQHLRENVAEAADAIQEILSTLPSEDISYFNRWESFLRKLSSRNPEDWIPGSSMLKIIEEPEALFSKAARGKQAIPEEAGQRLSPWIAKVQSWAGQALLVHEIRKNDRAASVMVELAKALERVLERLRVQPLWKFNQLIHDELVQQPASYLFERLGDRYRHFFIDEAQDTSQLQWKNLWPLLENALSGGDEQGSALIVGDGKQSIYRWRGSDAESFLRMLSEGEAHRPPTEELPSLMGRTEHIPLQDNWRSRKNIVTFNNQLFEAMSAHMPRPEHARTYSTAGQTPQGAEGGRVDIRFLAKANVDILWPQILDRLVLDLREAQESSWGWGDMAILVRDKRQGRAIALRLAQENIPVVSSELLALSSSSLVLAMAAIMNWMLVPQERDRQWEVLRQVHQAKLWAVTEDELHAAGLALAEKPASKKFEHVLAEIFPEFSPAIAWKLSLYEMGEYLARALKIGNQGDPFVLRFLDALHDYSAKQVNRLEAFMAEWERKKDDWSISAPPGMDAIELLTIHKAKGLEFPLVYVPFGTFRVKDGRSAWMELDWTDLFGLDTEAPPKTLLTLKSLHAKEKAGVKDALESVHPGYVRASELAREERIFDDYNLLYVALTRPRDGLCVYFWDESYGKELWLHIQNQYPDVQDHLKLGDWPAPEDRAKQGPSPAKPWTLKHVASDDWTQRVRLARFEEEGVEQRLGNAVHRVMERIRRPADVVQAMDQTAVEMQWTAAERLEVQTRVDRAMGDERLKPLFEAVEIYTERPLLLPGKGVRRPDRVVKLQDGRWLVVDYKTGEVEAAHAEQIERYAEGLTDVLGSRPGTLRVYLRDQIELYGS